MQVLSGWAAAMAAVVAAAAAAVEQLNSLHVPAPCSFMCRPRMLCLVQKLMSHTRCRYVAHMHIRHLFARVHIVHCRSLATSS